MLRALVPLGVLCALLGLLLCWPLLSVLWTHQRGQARILAILAVPQGDAVALRALWELRLDEQRAVIGDAQRDGLFRPIDDPLVSAAEAERIRDRLLPDSRGPQRPVLAFWRERNGEIEAFIVDVTLTHPWRRYIAGLAVTCAGLIALRLGLARSSG
ncbi:MAG: hypothetical protein RMM29_03020 [Planctomycetota bacterium]|nr:coenzyme F420-0:L-glutamate ligase [Planctomycetota bacterium]MCX8040023.1 coenzyme F420-0:L-glutamate ligase [Planctomycetota bacterium]MDW8372605.1 hypothetical protein [Planctomycetota bacterium]